MLPIPVLVSEIKDSKGRKLFVAVSPFLPCGGHGKTFEKAVHEAKDAIELYLEDEDVKIRAEVFSISG